MMPNEKPMTERINDRWHIIGFQGKDPSTDFRGMGLLGLDDLHYLASRYPTICARILSTSHHPVSGFSMAIVGINLTDLCLNMVRMRELQYHFYVNGTTKEQYHEFYCI
jgi:hypothetical protein